MSDSSVVFKFKLAEVEVLEEKEQKFRIKLQTTSTPGSQKSLKVLQVNPFSDIFQAFYRFVLVLMMNMQCLEQEMVL
nr:hypothetical protein [Thermodesulfobacterium geofontis]